jgi:Rod binding domain-containing protein
MTLFAAIQAPAAPPAPPAPVTPAAPAPTRDPAAWQVAQEFESFFISQMLEIQTSTIPTDGPFGGGQAERIFRSMQNGEHAKAITQRGGLGIAENVYREIIALQEASKR